MRVYRRNNSRGWWVDLSVKPRKRVRKPLGTEDKQEAFALARLELANEKQLAKEELERKAIIQDKQKIDSFLKEHFPEQAKLVKPPLSFNDALTNYIKYLKKKNEKSFSASTKYRCDRLQERFGELYVADINKDVVAEWVDERRDEVCEDTVHREANILRAILNKAFDANFLAEKVKFPKFGKANARVRFLSDDEEAELLEHSAEHLKPVISFAIATGGRLSEILGLQWRDVNLETRHITFRETKNGEDRTCPVNQTAYDILISAKPDKAIGAVFRYRGEGIASVRTAFCTARDNAKIEDFHFHDLRHTFASRLVMKGVPLKTVATLLGHKSTEMTERYSHLAPGHLRDAVAMLDKPETTTPPQKPNLSLVA